MTARIKGNGIRGEVCSFRHRSQCDNGVIIETVPLSVGCCVSLRQISHPRRLSVACAGREKGDIQRTSCTTFRDSCPGLGVRCKRCCRGCISRCTCVTFRGCERSVVKCFGGIFSNIKGESGVYYIC